VAIVVFGVDVKNTVATVMSFLHLERLGMFMQRSLLSPFVRAVNYHDVPPFQSDAFEQQLVYYKENFNIVGRADLDAVLAGKAAGGKPGLILSFDDGLRSHSDVVVPLLERHGLTGWFMVPVGFIDERPEEQTNYAIEHNIEHYEHDYGDPRIAMTWPDIRKIAKTHEIGCHTLSHRRLESTLTSDELNWEIPHAKGRLETELGREVQIFCWVGGEEFAYSQGAASTIAQAGFQYGFMTNNHVIRPGTNQLQLQRTNIEAINQSKIVRFQLSGVVDIFYWPKRRRVNKITRVRVGSTPFPYAKQGPL
jgi:peptidoglycan/xylan/chitin deacetylase (PgdA/CDA1 family)